MFSEVHIIKEFKFSSIARKRELKRSTHFNCLHEKVFINKKL